MFIVGLIGLALSFLVLGEAGFLSNFGGGGYATSPHGHGQTVTQTTASPGPVVEETVEEVDGATGVCRTRTTRRV